MITDEPATAAAANLTLRARAVDRALDRLAHRLDLDDVLLDHGIGRQRLDRIVLDAIAVASLGELQQLDRSRTDVHADECRLAFCDDPHDFSPLATSAYAHFVWPCLKYRTFRGLATPLFQELPTRTPFPSERCNQTPVTAVALDNPKPDALPNQPTPSRTETVVPGRVAPLSGKPALDAGLVDAAAAGPASPSPAAICANTSAPRCRVDARQYSRVFCGPSSNPSELPSPPLYSSTITPAILAAQESCFDAPFSSLAALDADRGRQRGPAWRHRAGRPVLPGRPQAPRRRDPARRRAAGADVRLLRATAG